MSTNPEHAALVVTFNLLPFGHRVIPGLLPTFCGPDYSGLFKLWDLPPMVALAGGEQLGLFLHEAHTFVVLATGILTEQVTQLHGIQARPIAVPLTTRPPNEVRTPQPGRSILIHPARQLTAIKALE